MSHFMDGVLVLLAVAILVFLIILVSLYRRVAAMLEARTINERRVYVHETGAEAFSFAESMQPESGRAERLEQAVSYMRRQFEQQRIPFDYEQARAVIEKAALSSGAKGQS